MIEFVVGGKLGIDGFAVARGARQQIGQAVIALRTEHEIDRRSAADDLLAFGLRDAAGDRDDETPACGGGRFLHAAHAAEFRIDLLGRLLADMAGVEDDEVGVLGCRRSRHSPAAPKCPPYDASRRRSSGNRTI